MKFLKYFDLASAQRGECDYSLNDGQKAGLIPVFAIVFCLGILLGTIL